MAEIRNITKEYNNMVDELIATLPELAPIKDAGITVTFLQSDYVKKSQGKLVFGLTEKVASKNRWAIPSDFTITIYTKNIKNFTDDQVKILLEHELLHIGVDKDGKFYVKPHDLEDFRSIIDKYGAYWDKTQEV